MNQRKHTIILLAALLALLALAACQASTPTPTAIPTLAAPTEAPTEATTAAPTEAPAAETPAAALAVPAGVDAAAWQPVSCDTFGVEPGLFEIADCGYVTVPENRAAGTPDTIQLAVVRLRSTSATPGTPVFTGTGGPGAGGLDSIKAGHAGGFAASLGGILDDRDMIFFSQRGTEFAKPELGCPPFDALAANASLEGWTLEERGAKAKEALTGCADAFTAQGVDLTGYNSNENAADVDTIRQVLGYDKIIYYGESYGTLLGQFVLRNHPEILESIILDGIAPASAKRVTDVTNIPNAFRNVFAACAADATCNELYPDLEQTLADAMAELRANPRTIQMTVGSEIVPLTVDDLLAMNTLFIQMYMEGGYAKLPAIIYALADGDLSGLNFALPAYLSVSSSARVMHFAINCSDDPLAALADAGIDAAPELYAGMMREDAEKYALICPALGLPQLPDSSDEVVQSDLPALLLQGGMDPATPLVGGDNVQTGLPNSFMAVVPAGAHIQSGNPCVGGIMRAFMNDPQSEPDTSCIDPALPFRVPGPVSYADPKSGVALSAVLPPTFQEAAAGQYGNGDLLMVLGVFDPEKGVDQLFADTVQILGVETPELVDGPTIAGLPSKTFQSTLQGSPADIYLFGDEKGTYRILFQIAKPDLAEALRSKTIPAILETVTVGKAPEAETGAATATTTGETNMGTVSDEDAAFFQQAANAAITRMTARTKEVCPDLRSFPIAEPDYTAKRPLDLSAFADAIAAFTPARRAELDALLAGKTVPEVQALLDSGELTSVELVTYYVDRIQRYDVDRLNSVIELNPQALADAAAADAARGEGKALGALYGIPVLF